MLLGTDDYRKFLFEELARRIESNSRYSQRAFARHLGMSPGELSEVLKGTRRLSLKSALKIAKALGLNQTETRHLALLVQVDRTRELGQDGVLKSDRELLADLPQSKELAQDLFNLISDWYHFAIINLAETDGFSWSERKIAQRLGISKTEVTLALRRLEKLGLIRKEGRQNYSVTKDYVQTADGIPSEAFRKFHQQILQLAKGALDTQGIDEREFSGVSFGINPRSLPAIKKDISVFIDQTVSKYSKDKNKKEVYHLEMAFFRLSQGNAR